MRTIIGCLAVFFLASCAHLPDQDVAVKVYGPRGPAILLMEKGYLDKEKHGKNWIYKHEFEEKMRGE